MYRRTGATPPRNPTLRKITVSIGTSTPWSADRADDRARPGDRERRRHRLTGTHALQSAVDTDPTGELQDRLHRGVAALGAISVAPNDRAISCRDGFRLSAMTRAAPSRQAAITAQSPTAPSPTTATMVPGRTPPLTAA